MDTEEIALSHGWRWTPGFTDDSGDHEGFWAAPNGDVMSFLDPCSYCGWPRIDNLCTNPEME